MADINCINALICETKLRGNLSFRRVTRQNGIKYCQFIPLQACPIGTFLTQQMHKVTTKPPTEAVLKENIMSFLPSVTTPSPPINTPFQSSPPDNINHLPRKDYHPRHMLLL